jgi:hypothetical protein
VTWSRAEAAAAVALVLSELDPVVSVFVTPPETLNPPAYVVGYARIVMYDQPSFAVDAATLTVSAVTGANEVDRCDALLHDAKVALNADPSLSGVAKHCRVMEQGNWRRLNIAGSEVLAGDLTVEIRM